MKWLIGYFVIQILIVIILFIASWFVWDRRLKNKHSHQVPKGFERTNEITIDPTTKKRMVIYYNPKTGERFYKEERP